MKRVYLLAWAAAFSAMSCASCSGEKAPTPIAKIQNDCTEWCEPAWEEDTTRQVCRDACREYVDEFRRCTSTGKPCAEARGCALRGLKTACSHQGEYVQVCEDSGRFAHHLMLEVCTPEP